MRNAVNAFGEKHAAYTILALEYVSFTHNTVLTLCPTSLKGADPDDVSLVSGCHS